MSDRPENDQAGEQAMPWSMAPTLMKIFGARRMIILIVAASTVLAIVVSFLLPKWYMSTTTLLPPKNQSVLGGLGGVSSLLKDFLPVSASKGLSQAGTYNYLALLHSKRAKEMIVRKFDLFQVYDLDDSSMEEALRQFDHNYTVEVADEGTISINIYDRDSVRAAQMANYAVVVLNQLNVELGATESRGNREFLETRLHAYEDSLARSEEILRAFQEKNGVVILSDEAKSAASSYATLYVKRTEAEIDLGILKKTVGIDNAVYQQKKLALDELSSRLESFPRIGMESVRLFRQVMIHQKILEVIMPLYEQARFEEAKDVPAVVVLDAAVPAERKSRPLRLLIVLTAFFTSGIISVMFILLRDRFDRYLAGHPDLAVALGPLAGILLRKK